MPYRLVIFLTDAYFETWSEGKKDWQSSVLMSHRGPNIIYSFNQPGPSKLDQQMPISLPNYLVICIPSASGTQVPSSPDVYACMSQFQKSDRERKEGYHTFSDY